jgi:hypothetical protein
MGYGCIYVVFWTNAMWHLCQWIKIVGTNKISCTIVKFLSQSVGNGATTFSIMTLSIMTLSITIFRHYAECHVLFIVMLNFVTLSVIVLSVVMLSVVVP